MFFFSSFALLSLRLPVLLISLLFLCSLSSAFSAQFFDKTPEDTYGVSVQLAEVVQQLRMQNKVNRKWPEITVQGNKKPRHAYQKALEVLSKINRYRQIHKLGAISTPPYPSREVTPNEVFDFVQRLLGEVKSLPKNVLSQSKTNSKIKITPKSNSKITPTDVYGLLWQISKAFDPLLGVRGFTPADVLAQSEIIVELIRFLRITQNISGMPKKPKKLRGKHSNHVLASAYQLQQKIHDAEGNLWMPPVSVPQLEKRVITPTEVYDALQTIIAELQRIKFRLGVERSLNDVPMKFNKTPDDVLQNLQWAIAAMPQFPLNQRLQQYDPRSLKKTPNDVFAVAQSIYKDLKVYKRYRGIRVKANTPPSVSGVKPRHVYQKTLENLKKILELRLQSGFKLSAVPQLPMRPITPNEVFTLTSRLDRELKLIFQKINLPIHPSLNEEFTQKTPSDVFELMWKISYELDTILGSQGQTPNDVFQMVTYLVQHIQMLGKHLGYDLRGEMLPLSKELTSKEVILLAKKVLKSIAQVKNRAGMFGTGIPPPVQDQAEVTPSDVYNLIGMIGAEVSEIEIHFGISTQLKKTAPVSEKKPRDVYQQLEFARSLLHELLQKKE